MPLLYVFGQHNYTHTNERAARLDTWLTPRLVSGNNMKKCRARYGLDQQSQWCKPCRCVPLFFLYYDFYTFFVTLCTSLVLVMHAPGVNNLLLSLTGVSHTPRTRSASMRRASGSGRGKTLRCRPAPTETKRLYIYIFVSIRGIQKMCLPS